MLSAVLLPKVEQSYCLMAASTSFCFSLLVSPSCPYSLHLSCFFTYHFQLCDPAFSFVSDIFSSFLSQLCFYLYFFPSIIFCFPLCSSCHWSHKLSNPVLNSYFMFQFFPSLSVISLSLSLLFLLTVPYPLPVACCIIQLCIFVSFPPSTSLSFL